MASYLLCKVVPVWAERAVKTALMPPGVPVLSASEIKTVSDGILGEAEIE